MSRLLMLLGVLALGSSCDDTVFPAGSGGGGNASYEEDFTGVIAFFHDHCHECHPALIQSFDAGILEQDIEDGTGNFVVPGDPEASRLWRVISGTTTDGDGGSMPPTGLRSDEEIAHVQAWILDGAPLLSDDGGE